MDLILCAECSHIDPSGNHRKPREGEKCTICSKPGSGR